MMTTNYTHIINENLDMIKGFDYPSNMYEMEDGSIVTEHEWFYGSDDDNSYFEDEDDYDYEEGRKLLDKLEKELADIAFRCGMYGWDEYREVAAFYSDVYKDVHGFRPLDIGLMYH